MANIVSEKDEKSKERKQRILDVAKKRFLHYGYKKTTMDEIALDAGMSKASIYQFFTNKEDILIQLIDSEALVMQRFLYNKIKEVDDPTEKLALIFSNALEYLDENPFLMRLLKRDPEIVSAELVKHVFEIQGRYISIIEEYVEQAVVDRENFEFRPRMVAYTMYKVFEGFSYYSTLDESDEISNEEIVSFVTSVLRRATGLGS